MVYFYQVYIVGYRVFNYYYHQKTKKTLLCLVVYSYIIAMIQPKIPYRQQPQLTDDEFNLGEHRNPMWANLLYSGVENRHKIKDTFKDWEDDPSLLEDAGKGLLGQYLLNQVLPDNISADLKDKRIDWNVNDRLDLGLSENKGTTFLDLGWRF